MEKMNLDENKDLDYLLKKEYAKSIKDDNFKKIVNTLKIKEEVAMKYTSKLEQTVSDLNNCSNCKHLFECKNKIVTLIE